MAKFLKTLLLYTLALWLINLGVGELLKTLKRDMIAQGIYYPKYRWQDFYNQKPDSVDLIFLGSSHAYRSLNPFLTDSIMGGNSFNLGSSGQSIQTAYYILKNAFKTQHPEIVVLEVYFYAFFDFNQLKNAGYNFDYIKWSKEKAEFLVGGFDFSESLTVLFFPSIRYKERGKYFLKKILGRANLPKRGDYIGKGFVKNLDTVNAAKLKKVNHFDNFDFNMAQADSRDILYLSKLKELCDLNNIKLIWVTAPIPKITGQKIEEMAAVNNFFEKKAVEFGVPYFNYLDATSLSLIDSVHFMDSNHLNWSGANIFTKRVSLDILKLKSN